MTEYRIKYTGSDWGYHVQKSVKGLFGRIIWEYAGDYQKTYERALIELKKLKHSPYYPTDKEIEAAVELPEVERSEKPGDHFGL